MEVADTMDGRLTTPRLRTVRPAGLFALALGANWPLLLAPFPFQSGDEAARMTSEPIIDEYDGPSVWDQLIPVCVLAAILLVLLLACLRECHFKYSRSKPSETPKRELGPLPKITVTNGRTGEERVIQE